jgi:hypothetical protein
MAWMDPWWDPDESLLWNMPGSFGGEPPRSFHLIPQSAWYAFGLLARDAPGDEARAVATIEALLSTQYDEPGTEWHGTFARVLEAPRPQPGAVMWVDFDPNWRQFVGTTFELLLQRQVLDADLARRVRFAVELAVMSERPDRVPPTYSNIALMRAWLEVEHDRPGAEAYAERVVDAFDANNAFEEYGSPTYYGIDLFALALWRDRSSSPLLRTWGARVEEALWQDIARWYHPLLQNLCGPWSRSYGMDMRRYAALLGVWMWPEVGRDAAPFPDVDGPFDHAHDFTMGPVAAHLGVRVPEGVELTAFSGEHTVEQAVTSTRTATGWLAETVMAGGEDGDLAVHARGQFHPATVHWAVPEGDAGWIRLVHHAPARAVASPGRLTISCTPAASGPELWVRAPGAAAIEGRAWHLPGLDVEVATAPATVERAADDVHRVRFPAGTPDVALTLDPRQ